MSVYNSSPNLASLPPILLDKATAASVLSISVSSLERLMKSQELPIVRLNGRVLFPAKKLEAWAETISTLSELNHQ